eukprot:CAMPEP_0176004480 /NCGR_PEP_ID=MMETSP0120_2-20121206/1715_1 /TAXON_ID=160619 /ORGANISM="Kryptoperidinium foliaceum, Strain CCMP 1326" /LENGTH=416 /DNA_ID=CAMNT_0017337163 /DNA_START=46 /DNA_END=1293 /DNA_ORIENTATION=+
MAEDRIKNQRSRHSGYSRRWRRLVALMVFVVSFDSRRQVDAFVSTRQAAPRSAVWRASSGWKPRVAIVKECMLLSKNRRLKSISTHSKPLQSALVGALPRSSLYLGALAVQFGVQPLLTKSYTPTSIVRSTVILAQDFVRFCTCGLLLLASGSWSSAVQGWTWQSALFAAGVPSILYMVQNYFALMAYQALPPVTFNIMNQTKTLSAALCCYLILGRQQSGMQVAALFLLLLSALVIEKIVPMSLGTRSSSAGVEEKVTNSGGEKSQNPVITDAKLAAGMIPIMIASFISGLAGAVSQKNLQVAGRDALVFSMELSFISIITMLVTLILGSPDGKELKKSGISTGWTWKTWIPVCTNAAGGVFVGLVTKHSGAVRKGFALIFGLLLSGILQNRFLSEEGITREQVFGGILASISVW